MARGRVRDPGEGESVELSLPADPAAVKRARELVRSTLTRWRLAHLVEVCVLAVSELVTNALRHGRPPIGLRLRRGDDEVRLEVEDHGRAPKVTAEPVPDELAESGRGLGIVRALADEVQTAAADGTTVSVAWTAGERAGPRSRGQRERRSTTT